MALRFPLDLPDKYYFSLSFGKYERPSPYVSTTNYVPLQGVPGGGHIALPLPNNLLKKQDLNWTATDSMLSELVAKGINPESSSDWGTLLAGSLGLTASNLSSLVGAIFQNTVSAGFNGPTSSSNISSRLAGGLPAAVLQSSGLSLNPILTQMFNAPDFRHFQFSWKFSPENEEESRTLKKIIDIIDYQSLPSVISNGVFFGYPSIAQIKLMASGRELFTFQKSVITSVAVNYAGAGIPAFFHDGMPAEVELTISFVEIILNTRNNTTYGNDVGLIGDTGISDTIPQGIADNMAGWINSWGSGNNQENKVVTDSLKSK